MLHNSIKLNTGRIILDSRSFHQYSTLFNVFLSKFPKRFPLSTEIYTILINLSSISFSINICIEVFYSNFPFIAFPILLTFHSEENSAPNLLSYFMWDIDFYIFNTSLVSFRKVTHRRPEVVSERLICYGK